MPFYFFVWTDDLVKYLAQHGVSPEEFEEVVCNPIHTDVSRASGRPVAVGYTAAGKRLVCIYEHLDQDTILPVTAFEPDEE